MSLICLAIFAKRNDVAGFIIEHFNADLNSSSPTPLQLAFHMWEWEIADKIVRKYPKMIAQLESFTTPNYNVDSIKSLLIVIKEHSQQMIPELTTTTIGCEITFLDKQIKAQTVTLTVLEECLQTLLEFDDLFLAPAADRMLMFALLSNSIELGIQILTRFPELSAKSYIDHLSRWTIFQNVTNLIKAIKQSELFKNKFKLHVEELLTKILMFLPLPKTPTEMESLLACYPDCGLPVIPDCFCRGFNQPTDLATLNANIQILNILLNRAKIRNKQDYLVDLAYKMNALAPRNTTQQLNILLKLDINELETTIADVRFSAISTLLMSDAHTPLLSHELNPGPLNNRNITLFNNRLHYLKVSCAGTAATYSQLETTYNYMKKNLPNSKDLVTVFTAYRQRLAHIALNRDFESIFFAMDAHKGTIFDRLPLELQSLIILELFKSNKHVEGIPDEELLKMRQSWAATATRIREQVLLPSCTKITISI
jgi:hypothetical protein